MKRNLIALCAFIMLISLLASRTIAISNWQQVGSNGFGDPFAEEVSTIAAFDGHLYAGTANPTNDTRIFRSADGLTWQPVIDPGFGSAHDPAPRAILDMTVFNGRLYASTGRGNAAQIWRTVNGTNWGRVVNAGFGDPDVTDISVLTEYNGLIYAAATSAVAGAQIWRSYSGDSNSWTKVAPTTAGTGADRVTGMTVFDGALYAAIQFESEAPVAVWRSFGGAWTTIVDDGFGESNTILAGGTAVFNNYLYIGAGNSSTGAQLWRTNNPYEATSWEQIMTAPFNDTNNQKVEMVTVSQNKLYVSIKNTAGGIEIWRSADGSVWEQVNQDGFGDSDNTGSNGSNATAAFLDRLYVGTVNVADGGELWRMTQPFGVYLSPDDTLSGTPGQTISYTLTITNTGTMTDTFNLVLSGNNWTTHLSSSNITLAPGTSSTFTTTVTIPVNALNNDIDSATITATSQGDNGIVDSTILTTKCIKLIPRAYLPVILQSP